MISVAWFRSMIIFFWDIRGLLSRAVLSSSHASFLGQKKYGLKGTVPWLGITWSRARPMFFSIHMNFKASLGFSTGFATCKISSLLWWTGYVYTVRYLVFVLELLLGSFNLILRPRPISDYKARIFLRESSIRVGYVFIIIPLQTLVDMYPILQNYFSIIWRRIGYFWKL